MAALRGSVVRLLEWVTAPCGPIDPAILEQAQAACDRGEAEKIEDIVARLESGGDLEEEAASSSSSVSDARPIAKFSFR